MGSGSGLDADMLDGYDAGNAIGNIPISNGTLNTNLNADMIDGIDSSRIIYGDNITKTINLGINWDFFSDLNSGFYNCYSNNHTPVSYKTDWNIINIRFSDLYQHYRHSLLFDFFRDKIYALRVQDNIPYYFELFHTSNANRTDVDWSARNLLLNGYLRGGGDYNSIKIDTGYGYVMIGAQNDLHCHFYTDRHCFWFNKKLFVYSGIFNAYLSHLYLQTNGLTRIFADKDSGNVGIGTTTPTEKLDVIGNIRTSGYIYHSSTDYVTQGFKLEASKQWFSKIEAENLVVKKFTTELEQIYAGLLTVGESAGKTTVAQLIEWNIKRIAMLDGTTSAQFAVDDIIMFQYYNKSGGEITVLREYFRVIGVAANPATGHTDYTVTRLTNNIPNGTSIPAGSVVIKVANYNGTISSTVTLDAIKGSIDVSSVRWNNGFSKDIIFKAGDLAGLVFNGTALTGKGLYIAGNAYITAKINATEGSIGGWSIYNNMLGVLIILLELN